jgi:hypothetical protein
LYDLVAADHKEPEEIDTNNEEDMRLVEITELPDEPPSHTTHSNITISHQVQGYSESSDSPTFSDDAYNDLESGLFNSPSIPPGILQPPQVFSSPSISHLPPPHHIQNSPLTLLPHHLPLLPPTGLFSPSHSHHRRVQSLYSHGPSLADQILSESDMPGINRSLSFGMRGMRRGVNGFRGSHFSPGSRGVGAAVRTNIQEHIEILNQHKCSIMNLMKDDFP